MYSKAFDSRSLLTGSSPLSTSSLFSFTPSSSMGMPASPRASFMAETAIAQAGMPLNDKSSAMNRMRPSPLSISTLPPSNNPPSSGSTSARPHHRTKSVHGEDGRRQSLYKTELCRSFEETGVCRYGSKCQFAHGKDELRPLARHPRYKTEVCKTFHTAGTCPYGKRCRFVHMDGLPRYWSPWSPLNYLLFYHGQSDDFTVDDYFALQDTNEELPSTPSAMYSTFQEMRVRSQRGMNGYDSSGDDSGSNDSDQNDHQPLMLKPVDLHLRRLPIFQQLFDVVM